MDTNEMLVRTMNAAKEARARGFEKTADAFDEIVESLLELLSSQAQSLGERRANSQLAAQHIH